MLGKPTPQGLVSWTPKTTMTSFVHLTALCCIPIRNPEGRLKERELLRKAALERAKHAQLASAERRPGRWDGNEAKAVGKQT